MTIERISDGGRESGHFVTVRALCALSIRKLSSFPVLVRSSCSLHINCLCAVQQIFGSSMRSALASQNSHLPGPHSAPVAWSCVINTYIQAQYGCAKRAGETASSCYPLQTPKLSNHQTPFDFHKAFQPLLHFQHAGSAYLSVHRSDISTLTYCHTATYMIFNLDPDVCSHIQDFAQRLQDNTLSCPHHHKSQTKATRKASPYNSTDLKRSHRTFGERRSRDV